ncbi:hypothetical protein LUZ60_000506 [Juncus effusus]|nr:hypothetical protein LUZ60_000506 [Juncus effusus]
MEKPIEAWEEMQRQGLDFVDRVAQGVTGFIHFPPPMVFPKVSPPAFPKAPFVLDEIGAEIGGRIGQAAQAGAEIGNYFNGVVQHFFRQLPPPFRTEDERLMYDTRLVSYTTSSPVPLERRWTVTQTGIEMEKTGDDMKPTDVPNLPDLAIGTTGTASSEETNIDEETETEISSVSSHLKKPKGTVNISCTYETRSRSATEASLMARGDLWRLEASRGGSSNGSNDSSSSSNSLFLVQLGPLLFVRDSTLLLPVHLSKQHLLWYGYDRKNGLHSLCPAVWSKHRRYLLMSMICLNPLNCSFMDLQFPNGQVTYVAGEGLTTNTFVPFLGGLLQAQGKYPGQTRLSFSCRNKVGTRVTPAVRLPDKSFSLEINQEMVYKETGVMIRPTVQLSVCPTFGGTNPGLRAEIIHTLKEEINLICGFSSSLHPSAFASLSIGRSKWNGNVGTSGVVISLETPLNNFGNPNLSVQLNGGFEF